MTREEAKEIIFEHLQSLLPDYMFHGRIAEAYKMAIQALEQEPRKITLEDVEGYCKPRCLTIISNELLYELTHPKIKTLEQQACEDYISREALLKSFKEIKFYTNHKGMRVVQLVDVIDCVFDAPSVTPQPKPGHWIADVDRWGEIVTTVNGYRCSECNTFNTDKDNFCPNCGAEMSEVEA